jgi:hypothetical protein
MAAAAGAPAKAGPLEKLGGKEKDKWQARLYGPYYMKCLPNSGFVQENGIHNSSA